MQNAYVIAGTLTDKTTIVLDEAAPLAEGRVRIVIVREEPPLPGKLSHEEVMASIRDSQRQRGYVPPTREEVDEYLKAERDSWGD